MNQFRYWGAAGAAAFLVIGALSACDISSSGSATRNVPIVVEGFYARANGEAIVSRTSGAPVRNLNLRQSGDQLEAIDNNGIVFRGTIGQVIEGSRASFTMEGRSTSGNRATLTGNFNVSGSVSTMSGSWIEDMLVGQLFATAQVPTNTVTDPGAGQVAISPSTADLRVGQSTTFTASGGRGAFTWSLSNNSLADISASGDRNATLTLTPRVAGNLVLTARDGAATPATATASITIQALDIDVGDIVDSGGSTPPTGNGSSNDMADAGNGNSIVFPPTPGQS